MHAYHFFEIGRTFVLSNKTTHPIHNYHGKRIKKKFLYAGVDLAAAAGRKISAYRDRLGCQRARSLLTKGKKLVDDFFAKSEKRKAEFEKEIQRVF